MRNYLYLPVLLLFITISQAQQPNDCVNAITICGNGVFTSNASGVGTIQEVNGCGGFEHNSIWLKVIVAQDGTLGFNLIPLATDLNVDYDFWVYGPDVNCSNLGVPIRCCTTNPEAAGLASNLTGLNNASLQTTSGPGASGTGYVRWLNVTAGETYYIAIDRPIGDGGFELHWTGSALLSEAPEANPTADLATFSMTPDVGFFDLGVMRSEINSDLIANSVNFFTTLANAVDNVSALPNIVTNTSNPQTIYVRVTNNATGCFSLTQFNLVVMYVLGDNPVLADDYRIIANPNPFNETFHLNVTNPNDETVNVCVYDMLGKLIDKRQGTPNATEWQIGDKYPSGVYNVLVTRGDKTKTLRVIKK
ncbi:MAG: T9SS type A sorting domain-containing protein [Bacteroidota bacterium]